MVLVENDCVTVRGGGLEKFPAVIALVANLSVYVALAIFPAEPSSPGAVHWISMSPSVVPMRAVRSEIAEGGPKSQFRLLPLLIELLAKIISPELALLSRTFRFVKNTVFAP